ncbi:BaiN/RdsA family NAD(P)/FAD-dependent oxidoreductase [Clostridium perfringens]|uniref:NAD(P)/FAD-dependent oxidoreductase n=1 Tax=Clostridium perfringens TaxID=1502 RepID=UPI0013E2BB99|nr:NAD(P)/FAD-dependent oxidoreductase [Clostridium perfringens]EHK2428234.1 NAD(P)/FAD-dependent oxidoreductase [Clostridium perfringens]ELC8384456.1 NAD(P)/FAD-dependent oxidoreductase [Clostridium perfringens]MDK0902576.1 NAD(P)/FAD-dependent oxidoreductase [Clostridium perfringens]MDT7914619.1 NAD(P)/FAD-dependent oxidoreductase [Clostridium perfringens]MDT7927550.1 NAD(P)/FAD-dependent oxidoreductase [Clostridium perfringens]
MIYHDVVIIGGGASGMTAAITAKDFGLNVAIVEGTDRIGKKILTTGNGRCNITNSLISFPFENFHSANDGFFIKSLNKFSVEDTKAFFLNLGLPIIELEKGKNYPQSLQASSVVDILKMALEEREIPVYNSYKVKSIHKSKGKFTLSTGNEDSSVIKCKKLIMACGGKSAPKTGSDGSGYTLAKSLGHSIIEPNPAIVQLKLSHNKLKALSGIKFNGYAEVLCDGKSIRKEFGEILFTDYGISGPPILQISREASLGCFKGKEVKILVDMMPDKSLKELEGFLEGHFAVFSCREVINSLIGVVNKKMIPILLREAGIDNLHKPCYELTWKEKKALINLMKSWEFKCIGTNGFQAAQVTTGGINTKEVYAETLQSKLVDNLYFCGELLDVDGDCGGFNLQWAWSSGFTAALSCTLQ